MSQVICLLVIILLLPAQSIAQDSVNTLAEPVPGSRAVDDPHEALKRLKAEMERLSQKEVRKSRPISEAVEQMERQRKEDETKRLQRLRELKRQLDRSMVDSNVSRFYNEKKRSKDNGGRLLLVIGVPLCGLWLVALIAGRIIKGKRVDTAALHAELQIAEDVGSIAEKVLTAIPLLERRMEYDEWSIARQYRC